MTFRAFFKKEIMEILRTSKIIVIPALLLFFGIMSPLSAKYTNQILALVGEQQGIKIILPDPTYIQAYEQLFKNIYFIVIVAMIVIFAGSVADEKAKGTAALVLTKNLSRTQFITTKLLAAVTLFTTAYLVTIAAFLYYTFLLFNEFVNSGTFLALFSFWLFGLFIISITFLASILSKSYVTAVVFGFLSFVGLSAIAVFPYVGKYSPGNLQVLSVELIRNIKPVENMGLNLTVTAVIAILAIIFGLHIFKKQEV
jgi:ABC-2 type transport system permease protein